MTASEGSLMARDELALLLERSPDPLAPSAHASLGSPEAPTLLPIWRSSRADLLATYEVRLARADAGGGPVTHQLREYTGVLHDPSTPETLDEVGWAVGDTFYVVLLREDGLLAVTTVARAVWYLRSQITRLDRPAYHWVDVKTFGIGEGFNDVTLIKNTLDQPAYADGLQGATPEAQQGETHGPYRLDAIDPTCFSHTSAGQARSFLQRWADRTGVQSEAVQAALATSVYALLGTAHSVYRFPALGDESAHESGSGGAHPAFHEFIAIDRDQHRLSVIVASED